MKKLVILFSALMVLSTMSSFGQRSISDTLQGNETVNFTAMQGASTIQVLCTELGGTSDGLIMLQGSVDGTSFVDLYTNNNYWFASNANDSLTITNGAVWTVDVSKLKLPYYRITGDGTASDTTLITIKWSK